MGHLCVADIFCCLFCYGKGWIMNHLKTDEPFYTLLGMDVNVNGRSSIYTLWPGNYDSFAVAILSQNHWEIHITESILASIKIIIEGVFQMMSLTIWPPV